MSKKAFIYCRISHDKTGEGAGVERQEIECRALAERHGYEVVEVFQDNDISAFSGKLRPSYRLMLEKLKENPDTTLIAWHTDRITRQIKELEELMIIADESNIRILTVRAGDLNLGTPNGRLVARLMGSVAMNESEQKGDRVRTAHLHNAKKGKAWISPYRSYGYNRDLTEIIEEEAEVIRTLAKKYLSGEGILSISRWANNSGHKTVTGGQWNARAIKRLLERAYISGRREYQGEITSKGSWPAIISEEESDVLRSKIKNRKQVVPLRRYLLTGLIYCDLCGAKLQTGNASGRRSYRCAKSSEGLNTGCNGTATKAEWVEELIVESVMMRLESDEFLKEFARPSDNKEILKAQNEISLVTSKSQELLEMYTDGDLSKVEFLSSKKSLEDRRKKAEKILMSEVKLDVFSSSLFKGSNVRTQWLSLNLDRQRAIINSLVERVIIKKPSRRTNVFMPERFNIVWKA